MRHSYKQKFIGLFLLTAILFGNFSAFAQRRTGGQTPASTQKTSDKTGKTCNSGYQGSVNYTKTVATNSTGRYGSYANTKRTYQTNIIVRDDGRQQGSTSMSELGLTGSFNLYGNATASETENFTTLAVSEKDDYCKLTLKGAQGKTRVHCESKFSRQSDSSGNFSDTNVYIGLRGDKMSLGISRLPKLNGTMNETSASKCSGTCSPDKPVNSSRSAEIKNGGETSVGTKDDANIRFDPTSFNRLSGSWTNTEPTPGGTVTENFQWNLSRCAPALEIANITFEHHKFPDPNAWHGIDPLQGTIDGNLVKVKARVFNNGGDTAYANVKFSEIKSGENLPDGQVSVAVKPGEYRDVEYEWDTSGFAWNENQKNESNREIRATLEGGNTETAKIKIMPKPIIMAHGLWSNAAAWAEYPVYMREIHSFAWRGYAVGADPAHGKMNTGDSPGNSGATNTIYQNAQELAKQVKFAREENNAWHVDIVAHSMGGLISRQYINTFMPQVFDNKPEVTHLVMLGTPNQGSPCADSVNGLFEEFEKNDMQAMRELKPILVRAFNARINNRKGVKFSILIGLFMPRTCLDESEWGDGVVPMTSAKYDNTDYAYVARNHIDLTGIEDFKSFVMPRIAIGPKKARTEQMQALIEGNSSDNFASLGDDVYQKQNAYGFGEYFKKASYKQTEKAGEEKDDSQKNVTTRQKVELKANESKEIEIPVRDGSSAGVVLVATPAVSATLKDAGGAIVGESKGGMEAMKELFRTIAVRRQITNGVWKLKIENLGNQPTTVFVAGITNSGASSNFSIEAGKPNAAGTVTLTAKLTENNAPVLNAKIIANLAGQTAKIEFFDDGKHGDGAANDGVYGATIEKLAKGEYFVEAKAEANNQSRNAVAMITVGGANPAVKTAAKTRRKS